MDLPVTIHRLCFSFLHQYENGYIRETSRHFNDTLQHPSRWPDTMLDVPDISQLTCSFAAGMKKCAKLETSNAAVVAVFHSSLVSLTATTCEDVFSTIKAKEMAEVFQNLNFPCLRHLSLFEPLLAQTVLCATFTANLHSLSIVVDFRERGLLSMLPTGLRIFVLRLQHAKQEEFNKSSEFNIFWPVMPLVRHFGFCMHTEKKQNTKTKAVNIITAQRFPSLKSLLFTFECDQTSLLPLMQNQLLSWDITLCKITRFSTTLPKLQELVCDPEELGYLHSKNKHDLFPNLRRIIVIGTIVDTKEKIKELQDTFQQFAQKQNKTGIIVPSHLRDQLAVIPCGVIHLERIDSRSELKWDELRV